MLSDRCRSGQSHPTISITPITMLRGGLALAPANRALCRLALDCFGQDVPGRMTPAGAFGPRRSSR
jgi:hypothetical protein